MKIFQGFNPEGPKCPICHTTEDKPCILLPIAGTNEGLTYEAKAVHIDCLDLLYFPAEDIYKDDLILQRVEYEKPKKETN